jgi:hypothetical protein
MRQCAALIALFAWVPFCWKPLWGQTPGVRVETGKNQKQQAEPGTGQPGNAQRGTEDSPLIVDIKQHPKSKTETAEDKRINDAKEYRDRWSFRLAVIGTIISGLLLIIGTGGVYAAICTLRAIETQAEHLERQIQLQEAAMVQWVSVGNWRSSHIRRDIQPKPINFLRIDFDVANESTFPLTMYAVFEFLSNLPGATKVRTTQNGIPLFPRKPYGFNVSLEITEEQSRQFFESALRIAVHGKITHLGVSTKRGPLMTIDGNLVCRRDAATTLEYESYSLTARGEEAQTEGQRPT